MVKLVQDIERNMFKFANEQISQMIVDLIKKKVIIKYHLDEGQFAPRVEEINKKEIQNRITE